MVEKSKLRIAFVTPCFIVGGAESYIIYKSKWLLAHGHSVVIISEGGENIVNIPEGAEHVTFPVNTSASLLSHSKYKEFLRNLSALLLTLSIDVIEAHNISPAIHVALCYNKTKIPYFINILSEISYDKNWVLRKLTVNLDRVGLFYTLYDEMKIYIEKKVKCKLHPHLLPIPINEIENKGTNLQKYILSVCRLSPEKMYVKYLIEDFGRLLVDHKINENYQLKIIGDGPLSEELNEQAENFNRKLGRRAIVMCGTVTGEELEEYYRNCMLYVGVGTTLLLGASASKPCILPGYSEETRPFAWGIWGENVNDKDRLAAYPGQGRNKRSYYDLIDDLLNNPDKLRETAALSGNMYKINFSSEMIMQKWEKEYYRIKNIYADPRNLIKIGKASDVWKTLGIFRTVRKFYRFFLSSFIFK